MQSSSDIRPLSDHYLLRFTDDPGILPLNPLEDLVKWIPNITLLPVTIRKDALLQIPVPGVLWDLCDSMSAERTIIEKEIKTHRDFISIPGSVLVIFYPETTCVVFQTDSGIIQLYRTTTERKGTRYVVEAVVFGMKDDDSLFTQARKQQRSPFKLMLQDNDCWQRPSDAESGPCGPDIHWFLKALASIAFNQASKRKG